MKYIVVLLIVSALMAQMADAQELKLDGAINGSVSGSIEIAGHRMNFTGEVRPKREAMENNGTANADDHKKGGKGGKKNKKDKKDKKD